MQYHENDTIFELSNFFSNKHFVFILTWYLKNDIIFQHAKFQQDRSMVTKVHSMKRKQYFASTLKAIFLL